MKLSKCETKGKRIGRIWTLLALAIIVSFVWLYSHADWVLASTLSALSHNRTLSSAVMAQQS
jgi:hypothetical protein